MDCYFDSIALVKLYADEPGTTEILALAGEGGPLFTAAVSMAEVASALRRAARSGRLAEGDAREGFERFRADWEGAYQILPVDGQMAVPASEVAWRHCLRGVDAVHLAAAITARTLLMEEIVMVTYDRELWLAAQAEGLPVMPDGAG